MIKYVMQSVSVFGSTGSIGRNAVKLISQNLDKCSVIALYANNNIELLSQQIFLLKPKFAIIHNEDKLDDLKSLILDSDTVILSGESGVIHALEEPTDRVIASISGLAGLKSTILALQKGCIVSIANKESIVCAGHLLNNIAKHSGASIIPIDSEHHALDQLLLGNYNDSSIDKLWITASGGPFLNYTIEELHNVTPEQTLKHPKWQMGKKISVDSATLMNKGLEVIEACNLFPDYKNCIDIVIHPESILHGMISYKNGSSTALMSTPDMKIPIAHGLGLDNYEYHNKFDFTTLGKLTFIPADLTRFDSLNLTNQAMLTGGNMPTILNAANEIAVEAFLNHQLKFTNITKISEHVMTSTAFTNINSMEEVLQYDKEARNKAIEFVKIIE